MGGARAVRAGSQEGRHQPRPRGRGGHCCPQSRPHAPALARDILRYLSLLGAPSLAPAVAMAKAEAADRALRLLSSSRHEVMTTPLL